MWLTCRCYNSRKHISLALKSVQWKVRLPKTSFLVCETHSLSLFFPMTVSQCEAVCYVTWQLNKTLFAFTNSVPVHSADFLQVTNEYLTTMTAWVASHRDYHLMEQLIKWLKTKTKKLVLQNHSVEIIKRILPVLLRTDVDASILQTSLKEGRCHFSFYRFYVPKISVSTVGPPVVGGVGRFSQKYLTYCGFHLDVEDLKCILGTRNWGRAEIIRLKHSWAWAQCQVLLPSRLHVLRGVIEMLYTFIFLYVKWGNKFHGVRRWYLWG